MKVNTQAEKKLALDYIHNIFDYDPKIGKFINSYTRSSRAVKGKEAGTLEKTGYIRIKLNGHKYMAHRLAWFYEYGKWPTKEIDHKDNIKHHNWIDNLREATRSENIINSIKHPSCSSKYKGSCFVKRNNKWQSYITVEGKTIHIGYFNTEIGAATAYNKFATKLHGEFAKLNIIK